MQVLLEEEISRKLETLPASSPAVAKLISIIDHPKTTRDEVLHLLALDQVLFANAFKYANSAALGSCRRLESLTEIVDILGFSALKSIAVLTALRNVSTNKELWFNGIFIALASKKIATELKREIGFGHDIFMAAMMQQYGLFALIHFAPERYKKLDQTKNFYERLEEERKLFGYNHLELSTKVLESWGLPGQIIGIIANQEKQENSKLKIYNSIIDLSRSILETGPLEEQQDFDNLLERNSTILQELQFKLTFQFIEDLFEEVKEFVVF